MSLDPSKHAVANSNKEKKGDVFYHFQVVYAVQKSEHVERAREKSPIEIIPLVKILGKNNSHPFFSLFLDECEQLEVAQK